MCHPGSSDKVAKLNLGLRRIIEDGSYTALCDKEVYSAVNCVTEKAIYTPPRAAATAEIVLMVEADFAPFSEFDPSSRLGLHGFDVELARSVCKAGQINCVLVSAPWSSAWPGHSNGYAGQGLLDRWYDCALGSMNTFARQQTFSFSVPYTEALATGSAFLSGCITHGEMW